MSLYVIFNHAKIWHRLKFMIWDGRARDMREIIDAIMVDIGGESLQRLIAAERLLYEVILNQDTR